MAKTKLYSGDNRSNRISQRNFFLREKQILSGGLRGLPNGSDEVFSNSSKKYITIFYFKNLRTN